MKTTIVYEDNKVIVTAVTIFGEFRYTKTSYLDDAGFPEREVIVYADGSIDDQRI